MAGTMDWSANFSQVAEAKKQLNDIAKSIRQESRIYQTTKQNMLNSWQGSHQEAFVEANASSVEEKARELATKLDELATKVEELLTEMKKRDSDAADILLGK